jgi:hypothetical protein
VQLPVDAVYSILLIPAALAMLLYRKIGSANLPITTHRLKQLGVFPIRNHYYEPLFDSRSLSKPLSEDRNLPGIDLNTKAQLDFLERLKHSDELVRLKLNENTGDPVAFHFQNERFESGDAEYLYQIVRYLAPSKIIEIGSGHSTKIANLAVKRNVLEGTSNSEHICIEPYEMPWLELLENVKVVRKRVEDCDLDWTKALGPGDILFVDSSHMIRPQGDVLTEYLEIFPRLASGVYIHIHDIFTPKDYLTSWVTSDVRFWNEQYLLEALLSNSQRYEIVGALNYLKNNYFSDLQRVCPYLTQDREPGSFYMRVR